MSGPPSNLSTKPMLTCTRCQHYLQKVSVHGASIVHVWGNLPYGARAIESYRTAEHRRCVYMGRLLDYATFA